MERVRCLLVRDPRVPAGGLERWVETLADGLPPLGIDVTVLVPGSASDVRLEAARVIAVAQSGDDVTQAKIILDACRDLAAAGECGVFFTLGYHYLSIVTLNLLRSPWLPIPVVHGTHPGVVEWIAAGPPRSIVVVSPSFAAVLKRELATRVGSLRARGRIEVIENAVPLPPPRGTPAPSPAGPFRIVSVTRLDEDMKRPFDYVAIAQQIRAQNLPFTMTLIGGGPAEARVREAAHDLLTMPGVLPREEVMRELLAADVFLIASKAEASSLAVIEALAAGCAVIASEHSINRDVVEAGAAIAVRTGDIDGFIAALRRLAQSPHEIAHLGERARRYAEEHYSAEGMLARYAATIRRVARHARPQPQWQPTLFKTPAEALPQTFAERLRNRLGGIVESFTT